jgi:hypothetical protein
MRRDVIEFVRELSEGCPDRALSGEQKEFILNHKDLVLEEMDRYDWADSVVESFVSQLD